MARWSLGVLYGWQVGEGGWMEAEVKRETHMDFKMEEKF